MNTFTGSSRTKKIMALLEQPETSCHSKVEKWLESNEKDKIAREMTVESDIIPDIVENYDLINIDDTMVNEPASEPKQYHTLLPAPVLKDSKKCANKAAKAPKKHTLIETLRIKENKYSYESTLKNLIPYTSTPKQNKGVRKVLNFDSVDSNIPSVVQQDVKVESSARHSYRKEYYCVFCHKKIQRFARHVETWHRSEPEVQNFMRYPKKHAERKRLIQELLNKGSAVYNRKVNFKDIIVSRRPSEHFKRSTEDYIPCPECGVMFRTTNLYRHSKKAHNKSDGVKAKGKLLKLSLNLKQNNLDLHPNVEKVINQLRNDEVSCVIKSDRLLLWHASYLSSKYNYEKSVSAHIRQKLRELAKLLLAIQQDHPQIIDFQDCLQVKHFNKVISGVQKLCKYNPDTGSFVVPSLAEHLGIYLKEAAKVLYVNSVITENKVGKKNAEAFTELMKMMYNSSISRGARQYMQEIKFNKPKLLPLVSDICIFRDSIAKKANFAFTYLEKQFCSSEWRTLLECTAALILIFNRKRPGETQRIKLQSYQNKQTVSENSDDYNNLTTLEKKLCQSFHRMETRGKLGRTVPILLRKTHISYLDIIIKYRSRAGVAPTNPFLFGKGDNSHIVLTDILRNESLTCGAKQPELLRATKLRKQVATTSQLLDLNDNEMQMLADFMGHDIIIHKSHYRTPELMLQIARMSKLLIACDEGEFQLYKDKTLKDIDVDKYLDIDADSVVSMNEETSLQNESEIIGDTWNSDIGSDSGQHMPRHSPMMITPTKSERSPDNSPTSTRRQRRQKISRKSWRTPEKKIIRRVFKDFLKKKTLPSFKICQDARHEYKALQSRTAKQIYAFINNQNKK